MKLDFSMAKAGDKYIGELEFKRKDGEYDVWTIIKRLDSALPGGRPKGFPIYLIGTATNTGLLSDYYYKPNPGESEQKSLEEINADLEVLATDGENYMSSLNRVPKKSTKGGRIVRANPPYWLDNVRRIINQDGEEKTDGQVLDELYEYLKSLTGIFDSSFRKGKSASLISQLLKISSPSKVGNIGDEGATLDEVFRIIKKYSNPKILRGNPVRPRKKRCWEGYAPVPGMKPYSKGSCVRANPVGTMIRDLKYLGTGLKLRTGQRVKVEVATNLPYGGYYVSPTDGSWGDSSVFLRPGEITEFVTYSVKKETPRRELFKDAAYYRKPRRNPSKSRVWRVWEYDVWGNPDDSWEVNNRFDVDKIELSEEEENNEAAFNKAMAREGLKVRWKDIDNSASGEDVIYFRREKDDMPLGEITREFF